MTRKRLIYSCIAIICVSVVAVINKYDAKNYMLIVGIISGAYQISQGITDMKKGNNGKT